MQLPEEIEYIILEYSSEINKLVLLSKNHHNNLIKDERYIKYKYKYYYSILKNRISSIATKLISSWWSPN